MRRAVVLDEDDPRGGHRPGEADDDARRPGAQGMGLADPLGLRVAVDGVLDAELVGGGGVRGEDASAGLQVDPDEGVFCRARGDGEAGQNEEG